MANLADELEDRGGESCGTTYLHRVCAIGALCRRLWCVFDGWVVLQLEVRVDVENDSCII